MYSKVLRMDNIPKKLLNAGIKKYYKKNDIVIKQGDILTHVHILVKGKILVYFNTDEGAIYYESLLLSPCICGEAFVIRQKQINSYFECLENAEVIMIPKNTLLNLMRTDFDITMYIYNITALKFDIWTRHAEEYSILSAEKRIIFLLIELAELVGKQIDDKIKIDFKISQQFIGNITSVKRTSTVRTLDKLKDNHILEYCDGLYYINDLDLLKKFVE